MTKYIQGKDGKMAGSIGDGKTNIPTAPPPLPQAASTPETCSNTVDAIYEAFQARQANPAGYCIRCESDCDELSDDGYCGGCFDDIEEGRRDPMTYEELNTVGKVVYTTPYTSDGTIRPTSQYPATPYPDGSTRTVRFTAIPAEARTRCEFLTDGIVTDHKYLTAAEESGLGEFVDVNSSSYEVDAHHIAAVLDHMVFDDESLNGDQTNFEIAFTQFTSGTAS